MAPGPLRFYLKIINLLKCSFPPQVLRPVWWTKLKAVMCQCKYRMVKCKLFGGTDEQTMKAKCSI